MEDTYVRFEPNPLKIQAWRARLVRPPPEEPGQEGEEEQEDPSSPAERYARAIPTLLDWKARLVQSALWRELGGASLPPGILCVLERIPPGSGSGSGPGSSYTSTSHPSSRSVVDSVWSRSVSSSSNSSSSSGAGPSFLESVRSAARDESESPPHPYPYPTRRPLTSVRPLRPPLATRPAPGPPAALALPAELSAFIEYRTQLEDIFQDRLLFCPYLHPIHHLVLEAFDHHPSAAASTLTDIFYLLQLLIPGMLLIVHDTLTFVHNSNPSVSSERNPFANCQPQPSSKPKPKSQFQSQSQHGRAMTLFEISLGNATPVPSPSAQFTAPTSATPPRNRDAHSTAGANGSSGGISRVVLTRTRRGVPPAQWIRNNAPLLEDIFGRACLRAFHECAEDPARANWTTVYAAPGKPLELG